MVDAKVERRDFYVYVLFRPNGVPCYVGKGRGNRWIRDDRKLKNPHLVNIMRMSKHPLPRVKVRDGLSEREAFVTEKALIAVLGRQDRGGILSNMTDGGEGPAGLDRPDEVRQRISAALTGRQKTAEHLEALRLSSKTRIMTSEGIAAQASGRRKAYENRMALEVRPTWWHSLDGKKYLDVSPRCPGDKKGTGKPKPKNFGVFPVGVKWWHTPDGKRYLAIDRRHVKDLPGIKDPPVVLPKIKKPRSEAQIAHQKRMAILGAEAQQLKWKTDPVWREKESAKRSKPRTKPRSPEHCAKISAANLGRRFTVAEKAARAERKMQRKLLKASQPQ